MARHGSLLFAVVAALTVAAASASAYVRAADVKDLIIRGAGFVGDDEDELGLRGMITRRRLQDDLVDGASPDANATSADNSTTTQYISYGALRADSVPCDLRGASYYNCRPGAEANPYTRGCSAITQCRG